MTKDIDTGRFETVLRFDERQKLVFKFVVNGDWINVPHYKVERDAHGIENNYVDASELTEVQEFTKEETPDVPADTTALLADAKSEQVPVDIPAVDEDHKAKEAVLETREDEEKLTNVLTAESSYAAVSIPGSGDSTYENISRDEDKDEDFDASNRPARNRTAPEDVTPTNSNPGSSHIKQPGAGEAQDSEVTTLGPNSRNNSFTGRPQQPDGEALGVLKVPGSYAFPVKSPDKHSSRRDGLITRLRGLFRS